MLGMLTGSHTVGCQIFKVKEWVRMYVIHPSEVPTGTEASAMHRGQGGRLTDPHSLGTDPLDGNDALKEQRELNYSCTVNKTYAEIFHELLIGNKQPFEQAYCSTLP